MRILHVYRTYFPDTQGGLEEVIRQLCAGHKSQGFESRVFTTTKNTRDPRVLDLPEAKVVRVPESFEVASCNVALRSRHVFREQTAWADVVHYHFPWPFGDILNFFLPDSTPSLVTYHSDIVRQKVLINLYRPLMNHFLGSVDRIVCTSPNYFATSTLLSKYSEKVSVIPIGIEDTNDTEPDPAKLEQTKREFGSDFFLFVGVLRYYKGLHILLDAIKGAEYKVIVAGSGPTEQELKAQAARLKLDNLIFTGQVTDELKASLFHLSKAIVFPSYLRSEAFGVTLLEGAMHGKPLISTEVGSGTSHVNIDGKTGIVVAPGSSKSLRRAMDRIHENPDTAQKWGRNARARYKEFFNNELMSQRYSRLYLNLTEQDRNSNSASDLS